MLNVGRQLGARVRAATRATDLDQPVLGGDHDRVGQLDYLVARRPADHPLIARQLTAALATEIGTMLDRLIGIVDELPRAALMPRLATLPALGLLARRALGRLAAIAGGRQRAVTGVLPQTPLDLLKLLALLGDAVKQRQQQLPRGLAARQRDPLRIFAPQLHAP